MDHPIIVDAVDLDLWADLYKDSQAPVTLSEFLQQPYLYLKQAGLPVSSEATHEASAGTERGRPPDPGRVGLSAAGPAKPAAGTPLPDVDYLHARLTRAVRLANWKGAGSLLPVAGADRCCGGFKVLRLDASLIGRPDPAGTAP